MLSVLCYKARVLEYFQLEKRSFSWCNVLEIFILLFFYESFYFILFLINYFTFIFIHFLKDGWKIVTVLPLFLIGYR